MFLDTETTGFPLTAQHDPSNPLQPTVIQWGLIQRYKEFRNFVSLITRGHTKMASRAQEVHGISLDAANVIGVRRNPTLALIHEILNNARLVIGWNVKFDLNMLEIELVTHKMPMFAIHAIDLMPIAAAMQGKKRISLKDAVDMLGIFNDDNYHDALSDAACVETIFDQFLGESRVSLDDAFPVHLSTNKFQ